MRVIALLVSSLLLVFVMGADCGTLPCTGDDDLAECGEGGRCNLALKICEAIPDGEGTCDLGVFTPAEGEPPLSVDDGILTYDARDVPNCIGGALGDPYAITIEIDGPIDFEITGRNVLFSIDGGPPELQCPDFFQAFEQLGVDEECDGEATCFFRCQTCFEVPPATIGAIVVRDDGSNAALSAPSCADVASGLLDQDCDAIVDYDEGFVGTDLANPDSDGDGLPDGLELGAVFCGTAGCSCVVDRDPLSNTGAADSDSDDDGLSDGEEDVDGNGRVDKGETDPNIPAPEGQ